MLKADAFQKEKPSKNKKSNFLPAILTETAKAKKATTEKVLMIILSENQD